MVEGDVNRIGEHVPDASLSAATQTNALEHPKDQNEVTAPEAALAWDREIRIDNQDRVAVSGAPALDIKRHPAAIVSGALLLALGLGWIAPYRARIFSALIQFRSPSNKSTLQLIHPILPNRIGCQARRPSPLPQRRQLVVRTRRQKAAPKPQIQSHCRKSRIPALRDRRRLSGRRSRPDLHQCRRRDRQLSRDGRSVKSMAARRSWRDPMASGKRRAETRCQA